MIDYPPVLHIDGGRPDCIKLLGHRTHRFVNGISFDAVHWIDLRTMKCSLYHQGCLSNMLCSYLEKRQASELFIFHSSVAWIGAPSANGSDTKMTTQHEVTHLMVLSSTSRIKSTCSTDCQRPLLPHCNYLFIGVSCRDGLSVSASLRQNTKSHFTICELGEIRYAMMSSATEVSNSLDGPVILWYDYFLTLDGEIRFFWGRKVNSVTVLFFVNRYFPLLAEVVTLVHIVASTSQKNCFAMLAVDSWTLSIIQLNSSVILAIRTFALYGRTKKILVLLVTCCACEMATGAVSATALTAPDNNGILWIKWSIAAETNTAKTPSQNAINVLGCASPLTQQEANRLMVPWITLLLYDTLIFALTLFKAFGAWRDGTSWFLKVFFRDGSIYYLVIMMSNLLNIVTLAIAPPILKDNVTSLTNVMSVIMITRLMLNIQVPRSAIITLDGPIHSEVTGGQETVRFGVGYDLYETALSPTWEGQHSFVESTHS